MRLIVNEDEAGPFIELMRKRLGETGGVTITLPMDRDKVEETLRTAKPNHRLELVWVSAPLSA